MKSLPMGSVGAARRTGEIPAAETDEARTAMGRRAASILSRKRREGKGM